MEGPVPPSTPWEAHTAPLATYSGHFTGTCVAVMSSPSACQQALGPITPTRPYPPRPTHSHQVQLWHEHAIHRLALLVPQRLSDANPPRDLGQITEHHTL
jgi:hypothetical protein